MGILTGPSCPFILRASVSFNINHGSVKSSVFSPSNTKLFRRRNTKQIFLSSDNGSVSSHTSKQAFGNVNGQLPDCDVQKYKRSFENFFCYDKEIPEEIIEKPIGLCLSEKNIGSSPRCRQCEAKGAVLCETCSGSGLYLDSILESQGILVKVRCLVKKLLDLWMHLLKGLK
ncbi:uncharacterized protein LOC131036769 isoform X2 [Cryptomeria japonica]|uniref:uncharacterized protein LOC131036769 isoform X2 n=1 Tax=Cryptomeria japonica TaxID=3369 RepID=UPI0025AD6CFE|nr:uncharacterized protein LOC131036769 isoform X2 [Cryptomeria japonica]